MNTELFNERGMALEIGKIVTLKNAKDFQEMALKTLEDVIGDSLNSDFASQNFHEICWTDRQRKDVALKIFGSDWPFAVEALKTLKVIFEGYCPECGEPLRDAYDERMRQTYDHPSEGIHYQECPKCDYDTRK